MRPSSSTVTPDTRIVSIEMFEAVGLNHYDDYFAAVDRLLAPDGAMLLQTITVDDQRFPHYHGTPDWIEKHIFPHMMADEVLKTLVAVPRAPLHASPRAAVPNHAVLINDLGPLQQNVHGGSCGQPLAPARRARQYSIPTEDMMVAELLMVAQIVWSGPRLSPEEGARILAQSPGVANRTNVPPPGEGPVVVIVQSSETAGPFGEFKPFPPAHRLDGTLLSQRPWDSFVHHNGGGRFRVARIEAIRGESTLQDPVVRNARQHARRRGKWAK